MSIFIGERSSQLPACNTSVRGACRAPGLVAPKRVGVRFAIPSADRSIPPSPFRVLCARCSAADPRIAVRCHDRHSMRRHGGLPPKHSVMPAKKFQLAVCACSLAPHRSASPRRLAYSSVFRYAFRVAAYAEPRAVHNSGTPSRDRVLLGLGPCGTCVTLQKSWGPLLAHTPASSTG